GFRSANRASRPPLSPRAEKKRNSRSRSRPHPSPSPDRVRERPDLPQDPAALFSSPRNFNKDGAFPDTVKHAVARLHNVKAFAQRHAEKAPALTASPTSGAGS